MHDAFPALSDRDRTSVPHLLLTELRDARSSERTKQECDELIEKYGP